MDIDKHNLLSITICFTYHPGTLLFGLPHGSLRCFKITGGVPVFGCACYFVTSAYASRSISYQADATSLCIIDINYLFKNR